MKRTERRHLKENELETLARQVREAFEGRGREMTWVVAAIVIVGAVVLGVVAWRKHVDWRAHTMLADATAVMDTRVGAPIAPGTPGAGPSFPSDAERAKAAIVKFRAVADAYPSSDAGLYARNQEGALQLTLGAPAEASKAFQQVIDRDRNGLYGQSARLGLAEAQVQAGQYDRAIDGFKQLTLQKDGAIPVDGVLMQLGRAYLQAGKRTDAQQTFNRIVEEFPDSAFSGDAKRELDNLKKT
jgi:predicted negative regulator of RcsB-dependent stress response